MDDHSAYFYCSPRAVSRASAVITAKQPGDMPCFSWCLAFFQRVLRLDAAAAEFLAIALVLVYVGAVMVLFLFVVMMLDINTDTLRQGIQPFRRWPASSAWSSPWKCLVVLTVQPFEPPTAKPMPPPKSPGSATPRAGHPGLCTRTTCSPFRWPLCPAGGHHRCHRPDPASAQDVKAFAEPSASGPRQEGRPPARGQGGPWKPPPPGGEQGAGHGHSRDNLGHFYSLGAILFAIGHRHLPQPQEPHRAADGDRADAAGREHELRGVLHYLGDMAARSSCSSS